jgi:hypothetical protein
MLTQKLRIYTKNYLKKKRRLKQTRLLRMPNQWLMKS